MRQTETPLTNRITHYIESISVIIKRTVLQCPLGGIGAPVTPVTIVIFLFATNLNHINCVRHKVLDSEGFNVFSDVSSRYLKQDKRKTKFDINITLSGHSVPGLDGSFLTFKEYLNN